MGSNDKIRVIILTVLTMAAFGPSMKAKAQGAPPDRSVWVITEGEPVGSRLRALEEVRAAMGNDAIGPDAISDIAMQREFERHISSPPRFVSEDQINEWASQSDEALRAIAAEDYQAAQDSLQRVQELSQLAAEELSREANRAGSVLDSCLFLVRAFLENRQRSEAETQVRECRRLVPRLQPSTFLHPPNVRELLEAIDSERLSQPGGDLRVTSTPSGCLVRLNGVQVGRTPFRMSDLTPGSYRAQVECNAQRGRIHIVNIGRQLALLDVNIEFDAAVHSRPVYIDQGPGALAYAQMLARKMGAQVLLVQEVEGRSTLYYRVHRVTAGGHRASETVPFEQLERATAALMHEPPPTGSDGPGENVNFALDDVDAGNSGDFEEGESLNWQEIAGPTLLIAGVLDAAAWPIAAAIVFDELQVPSEMKTITTSIPIETVIGLSALGVAVAAVGVVLWVTAPGEEESAESTTEIGLGPQQITLRHTF